MKSSINVIHKKRGRPATGHDAVSAIRLSNELKEALDKYVAADKAKSRTDAIRQIVTESLKRRGFLGKD